MNIGIYGFGSIGRLLAKYALKRGYEIIGVVDIDEKLMGKDIGEMIGLDEEYGVEVVNDPIVLSDADIVFHATSSYLDKIYPQLISVIELGVDIISTCETLAYPYYRYPVLARKLDEYARIYGSTVIGTGINPGFITDTLAIIMASSLPVIEKIHVVRSIDASKRRTSFQEKIGVGKDPENIRKLLREGKITGHVGYIESIYLIADSIGVELSHVEEGQDIVIAEKDIVVNNIRVDKGKVKGIKGYGIGFIGDREVIRLELYAYVGAEDYEEIVVEGEERILKWRSNGTHGDHGTIAILLNLAEKIGYYGPGLVTMADLIPFKPYIRL